MGGGAKISWAQGRKVPKYGPACSVWHHHSLGVVMVAV